MKKKYSLTTIAVLGLMSGLMAAEPAEVQSQEVETDLVSFNKNADACTPPSAKQEIWLFSKINSESKKLYNSMDCEGKNMAMSLAEQRELKDKNEAVQTAAKTMAKKRTDLMKASKNTFKKN